MKKIIINDEKILFPKDVFNIDEHTIQKHFAKPVRGFANIFSVKDDEKELKGTEYNLVLLKGREYIAQLISGKIGVNNSDLRDYKLSHFAIGSGGVDGEDDNGNLQKDGPYDNDTDLYDIAQIGEDDNSSENNNHHYVDNGKLKSLDSNVNSACGVIITTESHEVNTADGMISVNADTIMKFSLMITKNEPVQHPFKFNEAGLYLVKHDENGVIINEDGSVNKVLFARFTTFNKWLEENDSLLIEWYILI